MACFLTLADPPLLETSLTAVRLPPFPISMTASEELLPGLLITFVQFIVTAFFTWPTHFSLSQPPFFLRSRAIPLTRWLPNIVLFFTVNLLNNFAFRYNISVPVHIILRSGGSVTSMIVGFAWGKRYTTMQVFSVAMLTVGIITAAMADAHSKVYYKFHTVSLPLIKLREFPLLRSQPG